MTRLEHSDRILAAAPGETLLVVEPCIGTNMREGGSIAYGVGARLRVKLTIGDLVWCLDDKARSVMFDKRGMEGLERASA